MDFTGRNRNTGRATTPGGRRQGLNPTQPCHRPDPAYRFPCYLVRSGRQIPEGGQDPGAPGKASEREDNP
jgi:hypothetical protein